jgi:CRP-like cAMP-binding protein
MVTFFSTMFHLTSLRCCSQSSGWMCSPTSGLPHTGQMANISTWQFGHFPGFSDSLPHSGQTYFSLAIAQASFCSRYTDPVNTGIDTLIISRLSPGNITCIIIATGAHTGDYPCGCMCYNPPTCRYMSSMCTVRRGELQETSKARILKRSPIFSGLSDDELTTLAELAIVYDFIPDQFIFWDGDAPEHFYVIAEGSVKVVKHSSLGKEFIIAFFGPGEMFGEVAVFENKPYPASVRAVARTRVLGIRRENFLAFLADRPQVVLRIISVLGGRLRDAQGRLRDLAGERIEQRITAVLVMLSSKLGDTLPFTRQEIADMAGTTTETTIRVMSQLRSRGIIRSVRGKVTIVDAEKLRLLSDGRPWV